MSEAGYLVIIGMLGAAVAYLFWKQNSTKGDDMAGVLLLQGQLNELRGMLDQKLGDSAQSMQRAVHTQFSESQKLIQEVTEKLTEVREGSKQVLTIADSLHSLEQVLKNQKQRGNLGEAGLELVLSNILPPGTYKLQYAFADGEVVDAVIETKDGVIPIDAKFSLDNYMRVAQEKDPAQREVLEREFKNDLKKRIDETAKYIRPKEGTLPFAFMFIPAEGIYYDLLVNEVGAVKVNTRNLIDYAYRDKKVIIVSPTTFSAYLQSVLHGFRAFQIEGQAKDIIKNVEELGRHIQAYDSYMNKLGISLGTTVNHFNTAHKELKKIDKDVLRITDKAVGGGVEPMLLERPIREEE